MKWFFIQSLSALLAAFAVGIPIGYLIWRLQFRRVRTFDMSMGSVGFADGAEALVAGKQAPSIAKTANGVGGPVGVLDAPSTVAPGAGPASVAMLDRLRVEHAAELSRTRNALNEREVAIAELRSQLDASRKTIAERDARLQTLASDGRNNQGLAAKPDPEAKLQSLAEQRDAARAGLAKALGDYETRLASLRSEHEQESKSLQSEHAAAVERLNLDAENRINEIRSERESVAQALQQANGEFDQQRGALQARHEAALSDLRKRAERAESELSTVRSELETQRADVAKRTAAFEDEKTAIETELSEVRKTLWDAQAALERAKGDIAEATMARDSLRKDLGAESDLEQAQADLASARTELQSAKTALDATQSVGDRHRLAAEEARSELSALHAAIADVRTEHVALQTRYDELIERERSTRASLPPGGAANFLVPEPTATQTANSEARADVVDPDDVVDDLERIEGIGPRINASLQAVGIRTFERLAATGEDGLRDALARSGLNLAPSLPSWSQQAKFLAVGDEKSFRELVERLVAGREVK